MDIVKIGHSWPQMSDLESIGTDDKKTIFLHFWEPNEFVVNGETVRTFPHACVLLDDIFEIERKSAETALDWFCISGDIGRLLFKYELEFDTLYYPKNHEFIANFVRKFETELATRKDYYQDICEIYLSEFFIHLSREIALTMQEDEFDPKIKESLRFLRQKLYLEYDKKWNIDEMAKLINFSPSYLHATYKNLFGVSPVNDLIEARIEQAKLMLSESGMTVNEIALNIGYSNSSHFIRQFTGRVGISPQKFRRRNDAESER